jgi:YjjG family noncanonical pyrimidine nucleotidase
MKPTPYTWLLFDLDDTLFDFRKAEANALQKTLEKFELPFQAEYFDIYARCNQQVWKELERGQITSQELRTKRFRLFLDETQLAGDPQMFSPYYLQHLALGADLLPGADELIHSLKAHFHLALVTNGLADVQRPRLKRSTVRDCFENIFISEEIGAAKPARPYFDAVFRAIGNPPRDQVLIIGDSLTSDMRGGLDYGIDTCWYNPHDQPVDFPLTHQIKTLSELARILL